jgi:hypothetical protein
MLYWTALMENKNITLKIIYIKEQLILQIVPRHVHSWWLCHHLSVNEAAVASCSLATTMPVLITRDLVTSPRLWMGKS